MHSLTKIRAAGYSIMLVSAGALSVPAYAQGNAAAGEKIFAHCAACHSNKPGENKFGPSLAGVYGRKSGTEPGYNYIGNEGTECHLGPQDPGRMAPRPGQVRPRDGNDLHGTGRERPAYLKTLSK
jgi:hypothetical protein